MLTLQEFEAIPEHRIFAHGITTNSPEGVFMTDANYDHTLKWIAKKGGANDWAIYIYWYGYDEDFIRDHGDKVVTEANIKKLVPCEESVFSRYRY